MRCSDSIQVSSHPYNFLSLNVILFIILFIVFFHFSSCHCHIDLTLYIHRFLRMLSSLSHLFNIFFALSAVFHYHPSFHNLLFSLYYKYHPNSYQNFSNLPYSLFSHSCHLPIALFFLLSIYLLEKIVLNGPHSCVLPLFKLLLWSDPTTCVSTTCSKFYSVLFR